MKYVLVLFALLFVSCVVEVKTIVDLTPQERMMALSGNYVPNGPVKLYFSDADRLNLMDGPVTVISKGNIPKDWNSEETTTISVSDRDGAIWNLVGQSYASFKIGDVIKTSPRISK